MKRKTPSLKAQFLGKGLKELQESPKCNQMMYWIFSSMEKFQKELQECRTQSEAFFKFMDFLDGIGVFHETILYRVNEDSAFIVDRCSSNEHKDEIEAFVNEQIKSGKFGWAVQQNREVMVDAPDNLPGKQAILHALSTRQRTLGMFIGLLRDDLFIEHPPLIKIISMIIDTTVYVLENRSLEYKLLDQNKKLEDLVKSRTEDLVHSNQDLHQSNARLKKLNEQKSEFLGIVAHDLKNPLSGIIGLSQLMEMSLEQYKTDGKLRDPDSALMMIRQVMESGNHMTEALNQLINSEIIESGKIQLESTQSDLSEIVRKVVALNNSQANAKSIKIDTDYIDPAPVFVDPLRMQEAIDNLVSNAIKYSPIGGTIDIKVFKKESEADESYQIGFSIRDQGVGLSEDDKTKLFGRFQKLSTRPTAGESSTGLGLFIFKRLIDLHNGKVWVESEQGKGSEFGFTIPVYI